MTTPTPEAIGKALNAYHGRVRQWDDERKDQMSRAIAAADAAMEAAGFVRVPVEPTEAMMAAVDCDGDRRSWPSGRVWEHAYRAMIAARPTTPQDKA